MTSFLNLGEEDWELRTIIDKKSIDLFDGKPDRPQLQVSRLFKSGVAHDNETMSFERDVEVKDASELKILRAATSDLFQVYVVRQERSWTSLDISRELFEDFVQTFAAFPPLWSCISTFGKKSDEDECEFPGFRSRALSGISGRRAIESAYVIRRAELNNRKSTEGQCPWSIRQTAVYHRYGSPTDDPFSLDSDPGSKPRSIALLVAPSKSIDRSVNNLLEVALSSESAAAPCIFHSLLVADSVKGWMGYIAWFEKHVKEQSVQITFADLSAADKERRDGFDFSVEDRQSLKVTEDSIIDLQIILSTLRSTIEGIRKYCEKCCSLSCKKIDSAGCACEQAYDEFDEYIAEVDICIGRTSVLKERVVSTAQLLSDLLRYEDQKALKELTAQAHEENHTMRSLAEKSTKDAEAVKVLTIIGLVYLPTTFVANFFSTEFVRTDESGNMNVNANTWLLAAIALPLTILTVATWWLCVRYRNTSASKKPLKCCLAAFHGGWPAWGQQRKKRRLGNSGDLEDPSMMPAPVSVGTWSTGKTTLQDG